MNIEKLILKTDQASDGDLRDMHNDSRSMLTLLHRRQTELEHQRAFYLRLSQECGREMLSRAKLAHAEA